MRLRITKRPVPISRINSIVRRQLQQEQRYRDEEEKKETERIQRNRIRQRRAQAQQDARLRRLRAQAVRQNLPSVRELDRRLGAFMPRSTSLNIRADAERVRRGLPSRLPPPPLGRFPDGRRAQPRTRRIRAEHGQHWRFIPAAAEASASQRQPRHRRRLGNFDEFLKFYVYNAAARTKKAQKLYDFLSKKFASNEWYSLKTKQWRKY